MPDFVTCASCGLRHSLRADGTCPKCGSAVGAAPLDSAPVYSANAVGMGAYAPPVNFTPGELEGRPVLAFLSTIFFGLLALIACHVWGKPLTKRGANWGFGIRLAVGVTGILVAVVVGNRSRQLTPYEDAQAGWRMQLPRARTVKPINTSGLDGNAVVCDVGDAVYNVGELNLPPKRTHFSIDTILDKVVEGAVGKDMTLISSTPIQLANALGREVRFNHAGDAEGIGRVYLRDSRLYMLLYVAKPDRFAKEDWKPAFDSFQFTDAPAAQAQPVAEATGPTPEPELAPSASEASATPEELTWEVAAPQASGKLSQKPGTEAGTCAVSFVGSKPDDAWTSKRCLGRSSDAVFVGPDGKSVIVLHPELPKDSWQVATILDVTREGEPLTHVKANAAITTDSEVSVAPDGKVHWVSGLAGEQGAKPALTPKHDAVAFTRLNGMVMTVDFEGRVSLVEEVQRTVSASAPAPTPGGQRFPPAGPLIRTDPAVLRGLQDGTIHDRR